jgi:hypothetical protein
MSTLIESNKEKRISDAELIALKNLINELPEDQQKKVLDNIPIRIITDFLADLIENAARKLHEINKLIETHL